MEITRDSKGNILMWEGKPWDGVDPEYMRTDDGEEFYGKGLLTVTPPPRLSKEDADRINGKLDPDYAEKLAQFEKQIGDDNEERKIARAKAGIST